MTKKAPKAAKKHRVFLVDDHPIVLAGFTLMLNAQPDIEVCGSASSAEEAVGKVQSAKADLVISDITLPGRSGLDLLKDLMAANSQQSVLMVTMHDEMLYAERAIRAGARGYLMKEAGSEKMLAAIRHVLAGNIYVSDRIQAKILNAMHSPNQRTSASPVEKLSDREFEVFRLLGEGKTTKEIADQLHLSDKTVAVHRGHIKDKLGIKSATELMHTAVRWVEANR
jgi:DNA-binding NarL/FixJ family response regulator